MSKAKEVLQRLFEQQNKPDPGLILKQAIFADWKELEDGFMLKLMAFGSVLAAYKIDKNLSSIETEDVPQEELEAFLAELKKRLG